MLIWAVFPYSLRLGSKTKVRKIDFFPTNRKLKD